ncbi:MAG: sigma-70 family RNA polymerase sigma factor [Candidatus Poribacteria bacterium]|nr:sigma-70 family RNA polymerase sigma factor [Candidatus Poribacteria bacterium]
MHSNLPTFNNLTDAELIQLVQNRNEAAFTELIFRYTPRIWTIIVGNSRQRQDAEEIRNDVWMAVWQNIKGLQKVDSFGEWLQRIAYNACKRYYASGHRSGDEIPHTHAVLVEHIDQNATSRYRETQLIAEVKEVVHHLPEKVRSVAELYYLEAWHIKEIAEALDLPIGTVKTKLRETRALLREAFDVEPKEGVNTMQDRRPARFNAVPDDPTGNTWALPEGAIVRFGKGLLHKWEIKLSPDGTYFAMSTGMGLWWYDVFSTSPISLWETEGGSVNSFDFSHDGRWIVIANSDRMIKVLDVQSGECIIQIENQNAYGSLACSSNGKRIATSDGSGIVKVFDVRNGELLAQMDRGAHKWKANDISGLQFSPDGKRLTACAGNPPLYSNAEDNYDQLLNPDTEGYQIYVWDPETGEAIIKFAGDKFAFSEDSRLLAGASPDETVRDANRVDRCVSVWDIASGERIAHFTGHTDWVDAIAFSPCGQFVASSDRMLLQVLDIATGSEKKVYSDFDDPFYSKDGELLALRFRRSTNTNTTEVWNVENSEKILEISNRIGGIGFTKSLATAYVQGQLQPFIQKRSNAEANGSIPVYAIPREHRFPWPDPKGIWVNNQTLASKTHGAGILLWDAAKKQVASNLLNGEWVGSFTVLPDGKILAFCISEESEGKVWDAKQPDNPIAEFTVPEAPSQWALDAVFAPTGDRIAVGSRKGTIYVWNFEQPENPTQLTGHTDHTWSLAFSPDGKRLVSGADDQTARVWDVELGEEIAILPIDEPCTPIGFAFSPRGNLIVGSLNNKIRFWCAKQLTTLHTIPQPENNCGAYALTFSPCGTYLASGTWWQKGMEKMAIRLWDAATGKNTHTFWGHNSRVQSLAFSPDGTHLASSGFDGTILVWDLKPFIDS